MEIKLRDFESQILYFNGMYKLPVAPFPSTGTQVNHEKARLSNLTQIGVDHISDKEAFISRMEMFLKILREELTEGEDIIDKVKNNLSPPTDLEVLTDLADWLGDVQVYCASEMARYGIPLKETLSIIMSSNFSKLDANGQPIYDERGKVQKGPMYWKPEPRIQQMLEEKISEAINGPKDPLEGGIVWRDSN